MMFLDMMGVPPVLIIIMFLLGLGARQVELQTEASNAEQDAAEQDAAQQQAALQQTARGGPAAGARPR